MKTMGTEMKKLIWYTTLVVGLIGIPISALAIDAEDIIKGMEKRGYIDIKKSTTLFGNTLIVGTIDGSKHEFVINKSGVVLREHLREAVKQRFRSSKFFKEFDANGDGQLSLEERNNAKSTIRERIDADGDGKLSAEEKNNARTKLRAKIQGKMGERLLKSD